ncbi:MAG: MBL fold metallo-hydrolase [Thermoleophilia bacterium]|nr:MBL fold metallo-hydrolase [Thermoleophilia bacterium]
MTTTSKMCSTAKTRPGHSTTITIVVDNQAGQGLASEHGLSLWIETPEICALFDTGQGPAFEKNLTSLEIPLEKASVVILSHGHYDHTGGLPLALARTTKATVYCHPDVTLKRYAIRDNKATDISMPQPAQEALAALPSERLCWISGPRQISPSFGIIAGIPRQTPYEDTGGPFYLDPQGSKADPLADDLALWIRTSKGLVVCLGCAHAGAINTLEFAREITQGEKVHAIVGGLHLMEAQEQRMKQTITALKELKPDLIVPCHCTGKAAVELLSQEFGPAVQPGQTGMTLTFER